MIKCSVNPGKVKLSTFRSMRLMHLPQLITQTALNRQYRSSFSYKSCGKKIFLLNMQLFFDQNTYLNLDIWFDMQLNPFEFFFF